jgi:hypothetical protein
MIDVSCGTVNPVMLLPKAVGQEVWKLSGESGPLCRAEWRKAFNDRVEMVG